MEVKPLLSLTGITKVYGGVHILKGVSLHIGGGESIVLRGGNGSGKSTLLKITAGLIPATAGTRSEHRAALRIGYAPDSLPPLRMSSTAYLTHMARISGIAKCDIPVRIQELHAWFRLEQNSMRRMSSFSKGMLQKVNMMQAMLGRPELLVLDEPLSGLDEDTVRHLTEALKRIRAEGTAVLAAVHEPWPDLEEESRHLRLNEGHLKDEEKNGSEKNVVFRISCLPEEDTLSRLSARFPDTVSKRMEERGRPVVCFEVTRAHYRAFMLELTESGAEIHSLIREEE